MTTLFTHIKTLAGVREESHPLRGKELSQLPCMHDAFLLVEDGVIADYGIMSGLKINPASVHQSIDASGCIVLPAWCDSHTHLIFAGSREEEFVDKIKGLSYAEIAAKGGGILNSAKKLRECSEDDLFIQSYQRLQQVAKMGTGAIEIKSGYGLNVEGELKMLRVIRRLKEKTNLAIKATFLGAHSIPVEYKENKEGYIRLVMEEMLPQIAADGLADYIDVFCENGFFTPEETVRICKAGAAYGLKSKIHANQLAVSGGVQAGVAVNAVSVDHLESMDDEAVKTLSASNTIGTLLPTAAFYLRMQYQPARQLIDNDCLIALASDYNPGSSPSGNMNFVVALSCIQMRMLPEEAINAATINGAYAMELDNLAGSITRGKLANLILTQPMPSLYFLPYSFGHNLVQRVMIKGEWV